MNKIAPQQWPWQRQGSKVSMFARLKPRERTPSVTTQTYTNYHKQKAQRKRKVGTSKRNGWGLSDKKEASLQPTSDLNNINASRWKTPAGIHYVYAFKQERERASGVEKKRKKCSASKAQASKKKTWFKIDWHKINLAHKVFFMNDDVKMSPLHKCEMNRRPMWNEPLIHTAF